MTELEKGKKPDILEQHAGEWTQQLLINIDNKDEYDKIQKKYNHKQVKEALLDETNGKCCYCESKIGDVAYPHIEHIKPKARNMFPKLTFEWENLTLVCPKCNIKKSDYYSDTLDVLNPYSDKIALHIKAFGPIIMHLNSSKRGEITIKKIDLNRIELLEKRMEAIDRVQTLIDKYNREEEFLLKDILKDEIEELISKNKEYSFCLKCYCEAQGVLNQLHVLV